MTKGHSRFLMLCTAAIWGGCFVAQQIGLEYMGPFSYTAARFAIGTICLCALLPFFSSINWRAVTKHDLLHGLLLGMALTLGINLQQYGLIYTSVTHAGFITSLYVVLVPLVGIGFGHRLRVQPLLGALIAFLGLALMGLTANFTLSYGDLLQLAGAFVWTFHVLMIDRFANRTPLMILAILQCGVCALFSGVLAVFLENFTWQQVTGSFYSLLYGGVLAVAVAYTLQLITQKNTDPSTAAILFSTEAIFAALAGAWIMQDSLTLKGYIGCALMFIGILVSQWRFVIRKPREKLIELL